jgi:hypothetical protein
MEGLDGPLFWKEVKERQAEFWHVDKEVLETGFSVNCSCLALRLGNLPKTRLFRHSIAITAWA